MGLEPSLQMRMIEIHYWTFPGPAFVIRSECLYRPRLACFLFFLCSPRGIDLSEFRFLGFLSLVAWDRLARRRGLSNRGHEKHLAHY
jgi:hypothetical protein